MTIHANMSGMYRVIVEMENGVVVGGVVYRRVEESGSHEGRNEREGRKPAIMYLDASHPQNFDPCNIPTLPPCLSPSLALVAATNDVPSSRELRISAVFRIASYNP